MSHPLYFYRITIDVNIQIASISHQVHVHTYVNKYVSGLTWDESIAAYFFTLGIFPPLNRSKFSRWHSLFLLYLLLNRITISHFFLHFPSLHFLLILIYSCSPFIIAFRSRIPVLASATTYIFLFWINLIFYLVGWCVFPFSLFSKAMSWQCSFSPILTPCLFLHYWIFYFPFS